MEQTIRKNLYDADVYRSCMNRLGQLNASSKPHWGTMTSAQMLAHCAEIVEVMNGKPLQGTPFIVKMLRGIIRKMVLSDKPYPENSGTHPQYKIQGDRDFDTERNRLLTTLDRFATMSKDEVAALRHPLFGAMTLEERGTSMFKHLDHHLQQFGV